MFQTPIFTSLTFYQYQINLLQVFL